LPSVEYSHRSDKCGRWCLHLRAFTWYEESYASERGNAPLDFFAPSSEWLVRRNAHYGFAAKGGTNNEPHNHNDVGSFILSANGRQILCDLGGGIYSAQYFNPATRYGFLHCSSRGHSVPMIGAALQKFGAEYRARAVTYENGTLCMDSAGAYDLPELESLVRTFTFTNESVTLEDRFSYTGKDALTERFVTLDRPILADAGVLTVGGATLTYDSARVTLTVNEEDVLHKSNESEKRPKASETVYLIDFTLREGVSAFTLTMKVSH